MPNSYFLVFEFLIYFQFLLCLVHAMRHGVPAMLKLLCGALFGLLLELGTIRIFHAYHYGRFLLMAFEVPVCIALAWGAIIYAVMEFSDATNLPMWARSLLDGLLALNMDLALEAVAIRLGFWDWGGGLDFQFFGAPYANFLAWFWVVSSFSFGYRTFVKHRGRLPEWLAAPVGLLTGLIVVMATNAFMAYVLPFGFHGLFVVLIFVTAILLIVSRKPIFHLYPLPKLTFYVPLLSIFYSYMASITSGIWWREPIVTILTICMLLILAPLHWPFYGKYPSWLTRLMKYLNNPMK